MILTITAESTDSAGYAVIALRIVDPVSSSMDDGVVSDVTATASAPRFYVVRSPLDSLKDSRST